jgi:hypothetical protein
VERVKVLACVPNGSKFGIEGLDEIHTPMLFWKNKHIGGGRIGTRYCGANSIIGVRYDAKELTADLAEVLCDGTAVQVEPFDGV